MNQFNGVRRNPLAFLRPPAGIRRAPRGGWIALGLLIGLAHPSPVSAQLAAPDASPAATSAPAALPPDGKPPEPKPKREEIQQRLEQSKTLPELDDQQKAAVVEAYQKALKELDRADACAKLAADFDQRIKSAPVELQNARKELEQPAVTPKLEMPANSSLAELESELTQKKTELAGAQESLTRLEAEPKRRAERRLTSIPKESEQASNQLAEVVKSLQAPPAEGDPEPLRAARRTLLSARKLARENEIAALKSERECYNAEDELLPKQRDLAMRNVALKKAEVEAWQTIIQERRATDATRKLQQAVREKKQTSPELQGIAAENEELAKRVKTINDNISVAEQQSNEFKNVLADLKRNYAALKSRYNTFEATPEIGPLLLQYRAELRRRRQQLDQVRVADSTIVQVDLESTKLNEDRRKLNDVTARAKEIMGTLDLSGPHPPTREALDYELRELLRNRCDILDSLIAAYNRYFGKLSGELREVESDLDEEIAEQANYIDERILWVRSASALSPADLAAAVQCVTWFASPTQWATVFRILAADFAKHSFLLVGVGGLLGALWAAQRKMRARIRELGEQAARANVDNMTPTLRVLELTVLMSLPWTLFLLCLGWRLDSATSQTELSLALARGLKVTGIVLLPLELIRHVCRGHGLGQDHFGWPEAGLKAIRRRLRWFMLIGLPLTLAAAATHKLDNERWKDSLGRMLFIGAMLLLAVFIQRIFDPFGGILQAFLGSREVSRRRTHYLLLPPLIVLPLLLAGLAAIGYYYTAEQLAARLQVTAWLLLALLIAGSLAMRWVLVSRRRLAISQARQRRAAAQAAAQAAESSDLPAPPALAEETLDLTVVNAQTRRIVETAVVAALLVGLWGIWADVLPASSILNWELWSVTDSNQQTKWINVSHVLLACISFVVMVIAGRNIPGLLEISLLQRLPLEPATRYAITTLSRYAITVLGVIAICGVLGITWEKVHWLIAAVSVGLGFGLQEIFANFVSGLIILFERPIRVGDIVTVGDVSGVVSRIRMRATMIVDWDRKELIVPNKEFITGRVLNWTLSDQMNRIVVNVGVAYGSDVAKVRDLLLKIAREQELIMTDPAPMAGFEGFGDSSLNFVLRCYLTSLEHRLEVIHELHSQIHNAFQAEGIEIPFPQRDLTIRYLDAAGSQTVPMSGAAKSESGAKRHA